MLALDIVSAHVKDLLIFQTITLPSDEIMTPPADINLRSRHNRFTTGRERIAFYEHRLAAESAPTWIATNETIENLLHSSGFTHVQRIGAEIFLCGQEEKSFSS
jgi:tRNA (mo5U34)-methyltransferase